MLSYQIFVTFPSLCILTLCCFIKLLPSSRPLLSVHFLLNQRTRDSKCQRIEFFTTLVIEFVLHHRLSAVLVV